jgi:tetratricopeptide (TPR) repeat protein
VVAINLECVALHADSINLLPKSKQSDFAHAVELLGNGRVQDADALFRHVMENDPEQLDAELGRAQIAITEQRLDQAERMVAEVLKRNKTLPEAHNMKGLVLLLQKHTSEAIGEFSRAIALRPRYVTPRLYLALMARSKGDFARATTEYNTLTEVAPHLPAGYLGQAESLMLMRRQADAIGVLEKWKNADPGSLLPYQVLANVYLAAREPQEAIRQLHVALAKRPHDSATLTILGTAYAVLGDTRSAMSKYEAALAANGVNTDAAIRLGELEAGAGKSDQALVHFRDALKADPSNVVVCNNIAWLLAEQDKDLDEALRLAQFATLRDPKYVDAKDTLGWVRFRRGEYALAVSTLREARALAPSRKAIAAHLSLASAKADQMRNPIPAVINRWPIWLVVIASVSSAFVVRDILGKRKRRVGANSAATASGASEISPNTRVDTQVG